MGKSKFMTITPYPIRYKLMVNNMIFEQVIEIKYLGVVLTSDVTYSDDVKDQITKATE